MSLFSTIGSTLQRLVSTCYSTEPVTHVSSLPRLDKVQWSHLAGNVGDVPEPPRALISELDKDCPFHPNSGLKKKDTHLLCYIPANLDESTMNPLDLIEKVQNKHPKTYQTEKQRLQHLPQNSNPHGYWALITQNVVPGTKNEAYENQESILKKHGYDSPTMIEAISSVLFIKVQSGQSILSSSGHNYTSCKEESNSWHISVGISECGRVEFPSFSFKSGMIGVIRA